MVPWLARQFSYVPGWKAEMFSSSLRWALETSHFFVYMLREPCLPILCGTRFAPCPRAKKQTHQKEPTQLAISCFTRRSMNGSEPSKSIELPSLEVGLFRRLGRGIQPDGPKQKTAAFV